jgi:hypothetical protein
MAEFELKEDHLMLLLRWLVAAAPRLRAHLTHALLAVRSGLEPEGGAGGVLAPPEGLLPAFPAELAGVSFASWRTGWCGFCWGVLGVWGVLAIEGGL